MLTECLRYRRWPLFVALAIAWVMAFVSLLHASTGESQGRRVALIVGNSNYQSVYSLKNATNDSASISALLSRLGFDVIEVSDVTKSGFETALGRFSDAARDAEAAVFYYSGHGFQLGGSNFLVPVDAKLSDRKAILNETMRLNDVIQAVQDRNRQTLIFLDACRNNPLPESVRDQSKLDGLAQLEAGTGTFVAFATQPGNITRDGAGNHSPFAAALIEHMETPGISISDMMIRVRNSVEVATLQTQTPWDQSSLRTQFYFSPQEEESAALTDEDKELLASLNPSLRKKFEARFGIRIEAGEENEDGEKEVRVVKVKRTLLIQPGQGSQVEIVVDDAKKPVKRRFNIRAGDDPSSTNDAIESDVNEEVVVASLASDEAVVNTKSLEPIDDEQVSRDTTNAVPLPIARPGLAIALTDVNGRKRKPQLVASIDPNEVATKVLQRQEPKIATRFVETENVPEVVKSDRQDNIAVKNQSISPPRSSADVVVNTTFGTAVKSLPKTSQKITGSRSSEPETVVAIANNLSETFSGGPVVRAIKLKSGNTSLAPVLVAPQRLIGKEVSPAGQQAAKAAPSSQPAIDRKVAPVGLRDESEEETKLAALEESGSQSVDEPRDGIVTSKQPTITPPSHALEVQTELSRLGCYRSRTDGLWGAQSARALLRYYGNKKIAPDELEPTLALLEQLRSEEVVVCKRTIKVIKKKKKRKNLTTATRKSSSKKRQIQKSRRSKAKGRSAGKVRTKKAVSRRKALKKGLAAGVFR